MLIIFLIFLDDKQIKIDNSYYQKINSYEFNNEFKVSENKLDKYQYKLPESFNVIFEKNISNFYYDSKIYKNKSQIFTFLNSIFQINNKYYNLNDENEKELIMKEFIKRIDNDLFQKELYTKFNYSKNRKFNKIDIQTVLKNALFFKSSDKINLFKEYISDYLGVNIYVFKISNGIIDFNYNENYLTKYYCNNIIKFLPSFIIILENEIYKPLMIINNDNNDKPYSILKYSEDNDIIDKIWTYFKINDLQKSNYEKNIKLINMKEEEECIDENNNLIKDVDKDIDDKDIDIDKDVDNDDKDIDNNDKDVDNDDKDVDNDDNKDINENSVVKNKYNETYLRNQKIDFIKKICNDESIQLTKISDKTGKTINKLKNDLIEDLLKL